MKKTKTYKIESSPLYRLRNKRKLSILLEVNLKTLNQIKSDNFYNVYKIKQGNKEREIQEPKGKLKQVQKKIKKFLQRLETPNWLTSGKKGNSFVTNAKQHLGSRYFLTADIESFYRNSRREFVFKFFKSEMKMSEDTAWLITDLVTYKEFIPTGSPSSQIVAYLSYSRTFNRIKKITDEHNCTLSLYVDDLTVSSKEPIPKKLPYLLNCELKKVSHRIKNKKTRFLSPSQHKIITGCCVSPKGELKIPNKMRLKIKKEEKACLMDKEKPMNRLLGLILAARQIEGEMYQPKYIDIKRKVFEKS